MQQLPIIRSTTVSVHNGPHDNENEEEHANTHNARHIEHLSQFVTNKYPKRGKEEDRKNPSPHQHCVYVHTGTITLLAGVKYTQENQNENHNV